MKHKSVSRRISENHLLTTFFWGVVVFFASIATYRVWSAQGFFMDTAEHIHASWLVSTGMIPYRDFFEHHHPLLWYLFAPITQLFYRDAVIIYIAKSIAIGGWLLSLYLFYKLSLRCTEQLSNARLAVLLFLAIPYLFNDIQNLRPDIFMNIAILAALYCFFVFLDTKKTKFLCYSYLLWLIAFLFLQKALVFALGFGIAQVYFIKKKVIGTNIFSALFLPIFLSVLLLVVLWKMNLLASWWMCNFNFNLLMQKNYGYFSSGVSILPILALILAVLVIRFFKMNYKNFTLFCIWCCAVGQLLIFAPHPWYYNVFFMLSILLILPVAGQWLKRYFLTSLSCLLVLLLISFLTFYRSTNARWKVHNTIELVDYILKNTPQDEPLLNTHSAYNLFNPDLDYYWFGFHNVTIIADLFLPQHFSYNEQIYRKPKFIFADEALFDKLMWQNTRWLQDRNQALLQKAAKGDKTALSKLTPIETDYWQIDMDFIKKHYHHVDTFGSIELWQRIDDESVLE